MDKLVWLVILVLLLGIELATMGLTTIWFAVGALVAIIVAMCGGPVWLQCVLFFVVSLLTLIFTRPIAMKIYNQDIVKTNADGVVGKTAKVTEDIDNMAPSGTVYVAGKEWTARSKDGSIIKKDSLVTIDKIEGVKLIVKEGK